MPVTMYILEQQSTEKYSPADVKHIWGVYSSPENAQAAFMSYVGDMLTKPITWARDERGKMGEGHYVISSTVEVQPLSKTAAYYMHIVPMTLDFDVPDRAVYSCPACGEILETLDSDLTV